MRRYIAILAAALAACVFAAPAGAAVPSVVAMGDSSATGTGLGTPLPGTPQLCNRTGLGFPAVAMQQVAHVEFRDVTCDGSKTDAIFGGWVEQGIPAQIDALQGDEDAVILAIGDNNAGFGEVTNNCLYHAAQYDDDVCANTYLSGGTNALTARASSIGSPIGAAIDAIRARSAQTKVFLVGYLRIAPPDGAGCKPGYLNLTANDAPVFATWEDTVNQTLSSVAAAHGAYFVNMQPASLAHTACTPAGTRWVVPIFDPAASGEGIGLHPNAAGAQAVATALVTAMTAAGLDITPDTTDPVVSIGSPAADAVLASDHVAVTFSATDASGIGSCNLSSGAVVALTPGVNTIVVSCTDRVGRSSSASITVTYAPPVVPPQQPSITPPAPSPAAPAAPIAPLTITAVTPSVLRRATKDDDFIREQATSRGARFSIALERESFIWVRLERSQVGRKSGNRCAAATRKNRKRARCTRWSGATDWYVTLLPAGESALYLTGHNDGRNLRRGSYRVSVSLDTQPLRMVAQTPFRVRL